MNTFYHKEGRVFENELDARMFAQNFTLKSIDEIETVKSFTQFFADYSNARQEGLSISDALFEAENE